MRFDACLSFAGEDRPYVAQVAEALRYRDVRVFYDRDYESELWGKDLYIHFDDVFRRQARFCVIFVSAAYVAKRWTNHELRSAQARAFESSQEYLLPARFDATELPGLPPTIAYIDLRGRSPENLADLIADKVRNSPHDQWVSADEVAALRRENAQLREDRSVLAHRVEALQRDYANLQTRVDTAATIEEKLRKELATVAASARSSSPAQVHADLLKFKTRRAEAELNVQLLVQQRMTMANVVASIINAAGGGDNLEHPEIKRRLEYVKSADAVLAATLRKVDAERAAIQSEVETVQRIISKNIAESFRLMGS